ncbi:hypothetical protein PCANC_07935 [Puccinia coronata f. sp. avenae]|uniref:Uncharacterized protein n=1 Tax=Puccinia coronata f. sp. avenae TaxID=200324 RepID=A0A2N5UYC3_9BASI|nr:hypothetical protein PCASD_17376 [Puccinia coronata f. sp. avenae]PLW42733.1 hypothetical protein PCANC_07935 [Puccinia coronata f. sp. avenae]
MSPSKACVKRIANCFLSLRRAALGILDGIIDLSFDLAMLGNLARTNHTNVLEQPFDAFSAAEF